MNENTSCLHSVYSGLSGLVIFLARNFYFGDTVDTCRLTPFHGLITFFWGLVYIQFWAREEHKLAYNWGTSSREGLAGRDISAFTFRHEFKGELRKSEVTGQMEKYYPANIRRLKFVASGLITLVSLAGAFAVMILSLNAQGYIKHRHKGKFGEELDHQFHYPMFAALAEEGGIFDANSNYCSIIPVILHVALVMLMNLAYRRLAEILTDWESEYHHSIDVLFPFVYTPYNHY